MCYSSLLERAYEEYVKLFNAPFDGDAFRLLYRQREWDLLLKIPPELDDVVIAADPIHAGAIRESVRAWGVACATEIQRLQHLVAELEAGLPKKASAEMKAPLKDAKNRRKRIETALNAKPVGGDT